MADVFLDSNASGLDDGSDRDNAYPDIDTAMDAKAAGDTFWTSHLHAQTVATNYAFTPKGTISAYSRVLSVDFSGGAGATPPVEADLLVGAKFITTGNSDFDIAGGGYVYFWGITWEIGSGVESTGIIIGTNTAAFHYIFENNHFKRVATGSTTGGGTITMGAAGGLGQKVEFINCQWTPQHATDRIWVRGGNHSWRGGSITPGADTPAALFGAGTGLVSAGIVMEGVDISVIATLNDAPTQGGGYYVLRRCKIHASLAVNLPTAVCTAEYHLIDCNNGAVNYDNRKYTVAGAMTTETAIVRTGGASDGTTPVARKLVTSALCNRFLPFVAPPIPIWIDALVETTLTIFGTWGDGAVPNNDDFWLELNYLGSAASPLATLLGNGLQNPLDAEVALDADAVSEWGGGTTNFKTSLTFTPAMKGLAYLTPKMGLPSTTLYYDPKPVKT